MAQLSAQNLRIAFGGRPLLEDASLQIERGERVGLLGRNGEGKSTLLAVLAGELEPDAGVVVRESGIRVALLSQKLPSGLEGTVADVIRSGLQGHGEADHPVQRLCSLLELDPAAEFATQSGGQKRKALLGRALAAEPDVLLLDEPTNHLDIAGIEWLEAFLLRSPASLLFVTHDRAFLQRLATRIVELDRGRLTTWPGDYALYLRRKEEALANEAAERAKFDDKLAEEEAWIRQGIKARRTRNEGRVKALEAMRAERLARREQVGQVRLQTVIGDAQTPQSGKMVFELEDVSKSYEETPVVRDFSARVMRGDRVGLIGPNGAGKTTLLKMLLGEVTPDSGEVRHGANVQIAYYDQQREQLNPDRTVVDTVGDGNDTVVVNGHPRHVLGYLQDFLFSPERARSPVKALSGGERNRLLLARLFTRPANVLVLDEPTNDLDLETLELLEQQLVEWSGTLILVSHDRRFLDNVVTSTVVFEGNGRLQEYVGGYQDWLRQRPSSQDAVPRTQAPSPKAQAPKPKTKRTFKEEREYAELPERIAALEAEQQQLQAAIHDPDFYRKPAADIRASLERVTAIEGE